MWLGLRRVASCRLVLVCVALAGATAVCSAIVGALVCASVCVLILHFDESLNS